jgi:prohibitin 2
MQDDAAVVDSPWDRLRRYFKNTRSSSKSKSDQAIEEYKQKLSTSFVESKTKILLGIATAIVIIIVISQSTVAVPAGHRGVVLYLGAVEDRVLSEGFSFILPFVEHAVLMEVRTQKYQAPATASSQDLQLVSTEVALNYHLDPTIVNDIYQTLGENYDDRIIAPTIQESVKASTAKFAAEELITKREEAKATIGEVIRTTLISRGIITEQVFITDFQFSDDFVKAVESKVVAAQEVLRERNFLEKVRIQAQSREAQAIGIGNAKIAEAKGESEAIKIINEQLKQNPDYLRWQAIENWNGELPMATGGTFPFIDISLLSQNRHNLTSENSDKETNRLD